MGERDIDARYRRWRQGLLLEGETILRESLLKELSDYLGMPIQQIESVCKTSLADAAQDWEQRGIDGTEDATHFYDESLPYLFSLVDWHSSRARSPAERIDLVQLASDLGARRYLDFGAGIGSLGILCARMEVEVTLADVSSTLLNFARWRFENRGLQGKFIDLRREGLPDNYYDFVTVLDVLEHIPNPQETMKRIRTSMGPGAVVVVQAHFEDDLRDRPMHIYHDGRAFWSRFRSLGFSTYDPRILAFRKIRRSGVASQMVRMHDTLRCYVPPYASLTKWIPGRANIRRLLALSAAWGSIDT